ncbi:Zinc finger, CCCH-type [Corchorus capsularis]|uniref:Zinc finger, CCCH-type n=1 Tax=Corchorus capsularis TaxID=210143 RepID=A0A1R3G8A4_COCAP|nr:Zinc finger, CCCH-type [Corchorus capsularis]
MFANNNMNISSDVYKPMLQCQPQHVIQGKNLGISSHIENPPSKKRRICESFAANQWVPGPGPRAIKEVTTGGFKLTLSGSQLLGFANDSRNLCRIWNGINCSYGDKCRFLHVNPGKSKGISMINPLPGVAPLNQDRRSGEFDCKGYVGSLRVGDQGNSKLASWKTKLCNNWKMTGGCPYGNSCCFAHGRAELQNNGSYFALESWVVPTCALKNVQNDSIKSGNHFKQQLQETKVSLKWKRVMKLCDIYADWLEGMAILPSASFK